MYFWYAYVKNDVFFMSVLGVKMGAKHHISL